jgi:hypothetical protein
LLAEIPSIVCAVLQVTDVGGRPRRGAAPRALGRSISPCARTLVGANAFLSGSGAQGAEVTGTPKTSHEPSVRRDQAQVGDEGRELAMRLLPNFFQV